LKIFFEYVIIIVLHSTLVLWIILG